MKIHPFIFQVRDKVVLTGNTGFILSRSKVFRPWVVLRNSLLYAANLKVSVPNRLKSALPVLLPFFLFNAPLFSQSDDCPAAELISVFEDCRAEPSSTFRPTSFSTKNTCNGNTDDDGWFRFIAISPRTQVVVFSDQLANMAISVFETCRKEIACVNNRDMGGQEFLTFDTNIDQEYLVQVYHFDEGGGGYRSTQN